ncbi:Uncharacterized protein TCM_030782 [Theobroma cacao]|uniref:TF-B3 domain-containing protein n=1 Tax=Theobroma cacao TaxID=3641 RepID=A0A061F6D0_THECC|nr:Uncharacterized protein TCM_030782 [Theobroma cacao]
MTLPNCNTPSLLGQLQHAKKKPHPLIAATASPAMARVFEKSLTRKDKEKGLMISNTEASLRLLPGHNSPLMVKSANRCMVFEFMVDGESSCIIRGREWREFIGDYNVGSIVTLYREDDDSYKIQVR